MAKKYIFVKFEEECYALEKDLGRTLTYEEEETVLEQLWHKLHGNDPTTEELDDLWREIVEEHEFVAQGGDRTSIHVAHLLEAHKLLTH